MRISCFFVFWLLAVPAFCTDWFVSPHGSDSNDGKSPQTAWATLGRVNRADEIQPGDRVLWERGGIWRGVLRPHSGEAGKPVTYAAYGSEEKPRPTFFGSVSASQEQDWVQAAPNVWATREPTIETGRELDGNFQAGWSLYKEPKTDVRLTAQGGKLSIDYQFGGTAQNQVQLWGPEVDPDQFTETMVLQMRVRANRPLTLPGLHVSQPAAPWPRPAVSGNFEVTGDWARVDLLLSRSDAKLKPGVPCRWHLSFGALPPETRLEFEFLGLKEARMDHSLFLPNDVGNVIMERRAKPSPAPQMDYAPQNPVCGWKKWERDELEKPGDYWYDKASNRVFLYWPENPAKTFQWIELAQKQTVFNESSCHDVTYDGLAVAFTAAHGIGGGNTRNITVRNCDLYFIGGGDFTHADGTHARFGNAIEFWNSCDGNLVENCHIWEIYDAALTNQGKGTPEKPSIQRNLVYRNNRIENAEYSFEYWNRGGVTENVLFEGNVCTDAGICWSHAQRRDPNGGHLMFYQNSAPTSGFVVRNNQFLRSSEVCFRFENDWRAGLKMERNVYEQFDGKPVIRWKVKNYIQKEEFPDWVQESGLDQGSICR